MEKSEESCMPPYPTLDGIPVEEWLDRHSRRVFFTEYGEAMLSVMAAMKEIDIPDPFSCCEVPESVLGCMSFQ